MFYVAVELVNNNEKFYAVVDTKDNTCEVISESDYNLVREVGVEILVPDRSCSAGNKLYVVTDIYWDDDIRCILQISVPSSDCLSVDIMAYIDDYGNISTYVYEQLGGRVVYKDNDSGSVVDYDENSLNKDLLYAMGKSIFKATYKESPQ